MARAAAKPTNVDWKVVLTLALSFIAAIASYTTQQNAVQALARDVVDLKEDIKDFMRVRERTSILETKFDNIDQTLKKIAEDLKQLLEDRPHNNGQRAVR